MARGKRKRSKARVAARAASDSVNETAAALFTAKTTLDDSKKSDKKLSTGKKLVAVAELTEAFAIGAAKIAERKALRFDRKFKNAQLVENAKRLRKAGELELEQADTQTSRVFEEASQTIGTQRVQLAAQGLDPDFGSALEVQRETGKFAREDVATLKTNAYRRAFNFEREAIDLESQAVQNRISGKFQEQQTAITGGLSFVRGLSGFAKTFSGG